MGGGEEGGGEAPASGPARGGGLSLHCSEPCSSVTGTAVLPWGGSQRPLPCPIPAPLPSGGHEAAPHRPEAPPCLCVGSEAPHHETWSSVAGLRSGISPPPALGRAWLGQTPCQRDTSSSVFTPAAAPGPCTPQGLERREQRPHTACRNKQIDALRCDALSVVHRDISTNHD